MKSPSTIPLGPWPKGIQNVNDPTMTPKGFLVDAVNVLLDSGGVVTPRTGYDFLVMGGHSLFEFNGHYYGVFNDAICEITDQSAKVLFRPVTSPVRWTVLNNEPLFFNNDIIGRVSGERVVLIGVEEPGAPFFTPPSTDAERGFMMACSFVSATGEEGPLSAAEAATSITVPIPLDPAVVKARVYQTTRDGDVLYELTETSPGTSVSADQTRERFGRQADTQYKSRMVGGSYARYWRGRLLVARGRTLHFSEPLRYGLYDRSSGYVSFEARIDFIEPVEGGVYVALNGLGVRFLAGETPGKWEQRTATPIRAQAGSSLTIPTVQMDLKIQNPPDWVAVWFSPHGFVLGLPSGNVMFPQKDALTGLPLGTGELNFDGDRLTILTQ